MYLSQFANRPCFIRTRGFTARRAGLHEVSWIIDLSARVQNALTSSGSKQVIGPLQRDVVESATSGQHCYIFENASGPIGSVIIAPLPPDYTYPRRLRDTTAFTRPHWLLHSLMLEPSCQGKGVGIRFLETATRLMRPMLGTIFLDCWEGNVKLREFYAQAGFEYLGTLPEDDYAVAVFARELDKGC